MANLISFVILIFFFWGRSLRFKNLKLHILIMSCVIVADVVMVTVLAVWHHALVKAVDPGMPWTLKIHVPIALSTIVLYFATAWTGIQLYRGKPLHGRMRRLDRVLVPLRVLTLVTSLMVQFLKP